MEFVEHVILTLHTTDKIAYAISVTLEIEITALLAMLHVVSALDQGQTSVFLVQILL